MEAVVQQMRTQLEAAMNQLAATTSEMEAIRGQAAQAGMKADDAKAGVDAIVRRIQDIEGELVSRGGGGKLREVNFVDIKTLKPPMFKGTENFQAWAKKAKN